MQGSRVFNGAFRHDVTLWLLPSFVGKRFVFDYLSNTVKILKISKDSINRQYSFHASIGSCWCSDLDSRGEMSTGQGTVASVADTHHEIQFYTFNPAMRRNALSLLVTTVRPAALACAAIHKSLLPIDRP
jgi:hypothetical protein